MRLTNRRWLLVLLGLAAVPAVVLLGKWREAGRLGGQQPGEPFRIAGNFDYVGANDVTSASSRLYRQRGKKIPQAARGQAETGLA